MHIVIHTVSTGLAPRIRQAVVWLEGRGHHVEVLSGGLAALLQWWSDRPGGRWPTQTPPGIVMAVGRADTLTGALLLGRATGWPVVWWIPAGISVTSQRRYHHCRAVWVEDPHLATTLPPLRGHIRPEVVPLPLDPATLLTPPLLLTRGKVITAGGEHITPDLAQAVAQGAGVLLITPEESPAAQWLHLTEGGLVIPPHQPEMLKVAQLSLSGDERLRMSLANKGRTWIKHEDLQRRCGPLLEKALARLASTEPPQP